MEVTLADDRTETIVLQAEAVPFIETPLGIGFMSVGIIAITVAAVFMILRRRKREEQTYSQENLRNKAE